MVEEAQAVEAAGEAEAVAAEVDLVVLEVAVLEAVAVVEAGKIYIWRY